MKHFKKELEHVTPRRDLYANKGYLPLGLVESGRGCPFTCEFCAITSAHKGKYRYKLVDKIIEDINNISQKMLYFADDNLYMTDIYDRYTWWIYMVDLYDGYIW